MAFLHLRATAAVPLVLLLLLVSHTAAWSMTQYLMTSTSTWPGQSTASTLTTTVTPTGSVKPIASNTTTITYASTTLENYIAEPYSYVLTLTNLILAPDASACATSLNNPSFTCMPSSTSTASPTITTRIFAPLVIQNPSSCTKTSFSYTSSTILYFGIGLPFYTALQAQAADSAEAVFVTTFVVTLSTNLGGQPVTTSYADIYLSSGAVSGLTPSGAIASFMEQCVDPSSSLCTSTPKVTELLQCTQGVSITYPNKAPSEGGGTTTGGASGGSPSPTTSKSDAESVSRLRRAEFVLGLAGLAAVYLVL